MDEFVDESDGTERGTKANILKEVTKANKHKREAERRDST
jgi:hypothetical protein